MFRVDECHRSIIHFLKEHSCEERRENSFGISCNKMGKIHIHT